MSCVPALTFFKRSFAGDVDLKVLRQVTTKAVEYDLSGPKRACQSGSGILPLWSHVRGSGVVETARDRAGASVLWTAYRLFR